MPARAQPHGPVGHAYQDQHSAMTLAEGLAEYYGRNAGLKRSDDLMGPAREFFRCHDACHVVFGCGTSLPHEAVVKLSSLFGTTGGLSVVRGYLLYDSLDIYRRLDVGEVLGTIAKAPLIVPRTIARCLRQTRRWPWSDFDAFLDTPLADLRRRFGIVV